VVLLVGVVAVGGMGLVPGPTAAGQQFSRTAPQLLWKRWR